jgi:type I restriction enzyme, S subunit
MKLPTEWKQITLGEIFVFNKKSKIKAGEGKKDGKYKFFTSSEIQNKFIDKAIFDGESLIFSTGGNAGVHYCDEKFSATTDCFVLKVDNKIKTKYVYYYLLSNIQILEKGFKGIGLKHLSKEYLKNIKIIFPEDISIQKNIISVLETIDQTKELRKESDLLTNDFVKAIFFEMFGDSIKNSSNWKTEIIDKCGIVSSGLTLNPKRRNESSNLTPYLRVGNVYRNRLDLTEMKEIHISKKEEERYLVKNEDVLVVEGHGNIQEIGRSSVWTSEIKKCAHQNHIIKIRTNKNIVNPYFLSYYLNLYGDHGYFSTKSNTTSGLNTISTNKVRNAQVLLPPIELQNEFSKIIKEIDCLKKYQKEVKVNLENLYENLMQRAFKGETIC